MTTATSALAAFLDNLATTLQEAATTARSLHDREADLPPVLRIKHIVEQEDCSDTTAWRKAKLGEYGPLLSGPGEPIRLDRDVYLEIRRRRREQAMARFETAWLDPLAPAARAQPARTNAPGRAREPADGSR